MRSEQPVSDEQMPLRRTGPRHAAPRKSLLSKYKLQAGKAAALASMPTAVLLGLTLSPRPAVADDNPVNPYAPGPCVTQPDVQPEEEQTAKPEETAKPDASPSPSASASPDPTSSPTAQTQTAPDSDGTASPSPSPTQSETTNPLDPLGIGDAIGDLLSAPDDTAQTTETTTTTETEAPAASDPSTSDSTSPSASTEDEIREAAEKAGVEVKEVEKTAETKTAESGSDSTTGEDGKERFPCPERDAQALADADVEPGIPLLPNEPWTLKTTRLDLHGLKYEGIVKVKTQDGTIKPVLKFTAAKGVEIKDLHQIVQGPGERTTHVRTDEGSTSTMTDGVVTMYTESLTGLLFGVIPIQFSPGFPPPVQIEEVFFTHATVKQAGQFGGTLTLHGMDQTIE
ncbi:hypothetical protein AB0M28_08530 [Streptomyces sp. NPDC051940]|uniref:hypothetical protein n=1 Tax=Streptomyces sp. NPDC051940 TaxID=3155675 RepID=UPI00341AF726